MVLFGVTGSKDDIGDVVLNFLVHIHLAHDVAGLDDVGGLEDGLLLDKFAHHVLVQSEAMREAYITNLVKRFGEQVRQHYEEAIQVLESPKVYRVKHPRPEDLQVPAEWEPILTKPDGTRKKVIFYNTSVGTMTNYETEYLDKMRRVMDIFYENREDVVLLWRPHPLMKATIGAMEPELKDAYEKLVAEYRSGGWGIYDESPEMYRAIQLSDAYYGDPSSVLELYKLTEKPIMIENVNI